MRQYDSTYLTTVEASEITFTSLVWLRYFLFKQFNSFLKANFPSIKVIINIYHDVDSFLLAMQNRKIPVLLDAISAVDISGKGGSESKSVQDYTKLCKAVLQSNPESCDLWLDEEDLRPYLRNIRRKNDQMIVDMKN